MSKVFVFVDFYRPSCRSVFIYYIYIYICMFVGMSRELTSLQWINYHCQISRIPYVKEDIFNQVSLKYVYILMSSIVRVERIIRSVNSLKNEVVYSTTWCHTSWETTSKMHRIQFGKFTQRRLRTHFPNLRNSIKTKWLWLWYYFKSKTSSWRTLKTHSVRHQYQVLHIRAIIFSNLEDRDIDMNS